MKRTTGEPYSLLNQMLLGKAGEWLTFKQVNQEGGTIRKGEKSRIVVFWKWVVKSYDRATELESIGYDILGMPANLWKQLNMAETK